MNKKGVTLIELIAVIVIIGIIASILSTSVSVVLTNTKKKAFVLVGETVLDVGSLSYYEGNSIWDDDKVTLQELIDNEYLIISETDPWNGEYNYDLSHVILDQTDDSVVFKLRIVTSVAILGKDEELEEFSTEDIYFIESSSGSIVDAIKTIFDNDLEEDITLNDSDNLFTVQDDIKSAVSVSTLGGDDVILIGGSITDNSNVETGDGNDQVTVSGDISDSSILSTGYGNDIVDVKNKLYQGSEINTGHGNDTVTIYKNFTNATIDTGDGDDTLIAGSILSGVIVTTGDGDDKFTVHAVSNSFHDASIALGAGNDRLNIYDTMTGTSSIWDGGEGYDTLHLPEVSISSWNDGLSLLFIGFERVILLDGELDF